jgi:sulfur carrier protein ThiS
MDPSTLQNTPEVLTSTQPSHAVPGEERAVGPGPVVASVPPVDPQALLAKLVEETAVLLSGEDIGVAELLLTGKLAGEPVAVWRNGDVVPGSTPIATGNLVCWLARFLVLLLCT